MFLYKSLSLNYAYVVEFYYIRNLTRWINGNSTLHWNNQVVLSTVGRNVTRDHNNDIRIINIMYLRRTSNRVDLSFRPWTHATYREENT